MSWVFVPKQHAIYTRHVSRINEDLLKISHCEVRLRRRCLSIPMSTNWNCDRLTVGLYVATVFRRRISLPRESRLRRRHGCRHVASRDVITAADMLPARHVASRDVITAADILPAVFPHFIQLCFELLHISAFNCTCLGKEFQSP